MFLIFPDAATPFNGDRPSAEVNRPGARLMMGAHADSMDAFRSWASKTVSAFRTSRIHCGITSTCGSGSAGTTCPTASASTPACAASPGSAPPESLSARFTATTRFCQDDDPKVNFNARTMTAAIMLEIVANTRSGRALRAVARPMISAIRRMLFHQLSGPRRDKYERPEHVSSSGSLSPASHLPCR